MTAVLAATSRPARTAYVVALVGLLVVLDTTIMVIATATLADELDVGLPVIQWVTTGYTLALVAIIPLAGWLMGRFGAHRTYLGAIIAFTAGSLLAACSWDIGSLVAFRALQGMGGGLLMPVGMTIALQSTPTEARGRTMAVIGLPILVGPVLGPTLGGWLVDAVSWRAIFLVNLPVGIAALVLAVRLLPRDAPAGRRPLDLVGLVTLSPGITLVVLGLSEMGRRHVVLDVTALLPVVIGAALVAAHVARSRSSEAPLLRFDLLRDRAMGTGAAVMALFAAAYFGSMILLPLNLQLVRGESAAFAGSFAIPQALATGLTLQVASRLTDRVGARPVVLTGLTLATLGYGTYGLITRVDTPYAALMACSVVGGIGVGATLMPTMTSAVRWLDGLDLAGANTVLQILNQTMVSIGTAVTAVVFSALFAQHVVGVSGIDVLAQLSAEDQAAVAPGVAEAFRTTMLLPTALMLAALAIAVWRLGRATPSRTPARRGGRG